jgi:hypothetical protein
MARPFSRISVMSHDYLAEVTGPWTGEVVETMVALNAMPETDYTRTVRGIVTGFRQRSAASWVWEQEANHRLLHILGHVQPHAQQWEYVLDLSDFTRAEDGTMTRGRLVLPTLTVYDRHVMADKGAAMLNYALALPSPSSPNTTPTGMGRA